MPSLRLLVPWPVALLAACGAHPDDSDGEAEVGQVTQEDQCGSAWNVQNVATYDGSLGVTRAYVERH